MLGRTVDDPSARALLTAAALAISLPAVARAQDASTAAAYTAPRSHAARTPAADTLHGTEVRDPYRWLEAMTDPEVRAWVYAPDGLARSFAARASHSPAGFYDQSHLNRSFRAAMGVTPTAYRRVVSG